MYIAVCDDEELHLQNTVHRIRSIPSLKGAKIRPYASPEELIYDATRKAYDIDIAILDIRMKQSGIEVARRIKASYPFCQVIFLSGSLEYATQVYDVDHIYFILKSDFEGRIEKAIDKALEKLRLIQSQKIAVTFGGQTTVVNLGDIKYLERTGHRTRVVLSEGEYVTYERPEELLKAHAGALIRCHSSFFVNPDWVASIIKNQLELREGGSVPISRMYAAEARQALLTSVAQADL